MITLRKSALATSIFVALSAGSLVGINQGIAQEAAVEEQEDAFEIISISRKRPESLQ
jgi:iron complex outermembrane receptor protein